MINLTSYCSRKTLANRIAKQLFINASYIDEYLYNHVNCDVFTKEEQRAWFEVFINQEDC